MRTNRSENSEREKAILVSMALGGLKRQVWGWDEYTTRNESQLTTSSEYWGGDTTGCESHNMFSTMPPAGCEALREFERVNNLATANDFSTGFNELKPKMRQTSATVAGTEFVPLQSTALRHALYQEFEIVCAEIDKRIFERFPYQQIYDFDTFERGIEGLIKEFIADEKFKSAGKFLDLLLSFFPNNTKYKKLQELLAPPKLIESRKSKPVGIDESISFLKYKGGKTPNRWVAVSDGKLLDVSAFYAELATKFKNDEKVIIVRMV